MYYVITGIAAPSGFVNFRGASLTATLVAFLAAWFFSLFFTLPAGALTWPLLHKARVDGYVSYVALALLAAVAFQLSIGYGDVRWETFLMAALNGIVARIVEVRLRSRQASPAVDQPEAKKPL